jgi:hypothetical protein
MATNWIRMREDLHEDPAVLTIAQELDVRPETVVGMCHRFWGLVSRQTRDGCLTGPTLVSLGIVIGLPGFPELLQSVGWLEHEEIDGVHTTRIPKFERYLSEGSKARALTAKRKQLSRENMSRSERDICHTKHATREEKRREEHSSSPSSSSKKKTQKTQKKARASTLVDSVLLGDLPKNLQDDKTLAAINEWLGYKRDRGAGYRTRGLAVAIRKWEQMGPDRLRAAIDHSMAQNFQGIYEPKENGRTWKMTDDIPF